MSARPARPRACAASVSRSRAAASARCSTSWGGAACSTSTRGPARRADLPNAEGAPGGWQLPQGGIDADEDPRVAIFRELREEIGTASARIIGEHPEWLTYELPPELLGKALGGRYRGQRQRWFA